MKIKSVGVIGAGTMGNGIAQVFAATGFQVVLQDLAEEALQRGVATVTKSLDRLLKKEKISEQQKADTLANIRVVTDMNELADVDLVVEAAVEDRDIKSDIFRKLDQICKPEAILASNTSSISLTHIASVTGRSDKVIGMHFMNPVPMMKLVEIVRALQTSDEVSKQIEEVSKTIGKIPVVVNDSPGFVANRILLPMINEAIYTLNEGIADAAAIDQVMQLGAAHPMGPLALADLIGLDVCLSVMEVLHGGLGDTKYRPCPLLVKYVEAGWLGRKTSRGFYDYRSDPPVPTR